MRAVTFFGLLILGFAGIVIMPAITTGQPGGGKGSKGGFGGGGGFTFDAGSMFDRMANGRPSIPVAEVRTSRRDDLMKFVQDRGISNGQLTRQQFIDFVDMAKQKVMTPGGNSGGGKGTPFGAPAGTEGGFGKGKGGFTFGQPGGMTMNPSPQLNPEALSQAADIEFRRRDANGDGKLNTDEMPPQLRGNLPKYDKNGDSLIDINEFREYFSARVLGGDDSQATRGIASIIIEEEELDRKPVVFRAGGKMPAGLPGWFKELDIDGDAQIALWEWRKGGKSVDEFGSWDLNDDGFITPDEAVRQQLAQNKANGLTSPGSSGEKPAFGGFGGFGGKGGKKGGFGTPPEGTTGERPAFGGFGKGGFGKGSKKNGGQ